MWFECSAAPVFSTFWSKTSWNVSQRRNDTEGPAAKMHPPTYHLASLDPIEVYFNPKRLPLKADTDIFYISPILPRFFDISPKSTFGNIQQLRTNIFCSESFLLECFYLFVKDICLLQFGRPPDSKLDFVCSNCLVLFCRILLELQNQTTSSHSSVRNTIFILFTRSDFFISFVYYECDFYMRKPTVEKFCNV